MTAAGLLFEHGVGTGEAVGVEELGLGGEGLDDCRI